MVANKKYTDSEGVVWDSKDEYNFSVWLKESGLDGYTLQHKPIKGRKFRSDFTWIDKKIVVEVQGLDIRGISGHNSIYQVPKDYMKHLIYTVDGWTVVYYCKGMDKYEFITLLTKLLS